MDDGPKHPSECRWQRWVWAGLSSAIFALPWIFPPTGAGVDIFLKLDGIEGESTDKAHKGEIDVLAWSWGASNSSTISSVGKVSVGDFSITKWIDKSSPELMLRTANGDFIADGTLTLRNDGKTPVEFLKYDFKTLAVTSVTPGGQSGDDRLKENISLSFGRVTETYVIVNPDGSAGDSVSVFYDAETGESGGGTTPTNTPPTISTIADTSTPEDTPKQVSFTIGDSQTAAGALTLARGSNNQTLVPTANIVLGGSGSSRTATITPAGNQSGSATISIIVTDGGGLTATRTFLLTVDSVNDAPTIAPIAAQTTHQDVTLSIPFQVDDVDSPLSDVSISAGWNPGAVLSAVIDQTGDGANRILRITPNAASSGTAVVTLTASNPDFVSSSIQFNVTVNAQTGPLAINLGNQASSVPVALPENAAEFTELGIFDVQDSPGVNHLLSLSDDAGGRFRLAGEGNDILEVAGGALLDFESASVHTVVVVATDAVDSSRIRSEAFTIQLTNVNEAPIVAGPTFPSYIGPETDVVLTGLTISDPDPGAGSQPFVVSFSVTHGILTIDDSGALSGKVADNGTGTVTVTAALSELQAVLSATGLTYRGGTGFSGIETLTVSANDQGATGSGTPKTTTLAPTFEVGGTFLEAWNAQFFTEAELQDPEISGLAGNGDNDNLPNLAEYGIGALPRDSSSGQDLIHTNDIEVEGAHYPSIRFPMRVSDPQLVIEVQVATNLTNWNSGSGHTVEVISTPIDADFVMITIRSAFSLEDEPSQQIRIRFSLIPPM